MQDLQSAPPASLNHLAVVRDVTKEAARKLPIAKETPHDCCKTSRFGSVEVDEGPHPSHCRLRGIPSASRASREASNTCSSSPSPKPPSTSAVQVSGGRRPGLRGHRSALCSFPTIRFPRAKRLCQSSASPIWPRPMCWVIVNKVGDMLTAEFQGPLVIHANTLRAAAQIVISEKEISLTRHPGSCSCSRSPASLPAAACRWLRATSANLPEPGGIRG